MNIRDYWLKFSPAVRTTRNNKSLVVPAFSNVSCGPVHTCLKVIGGAGSVTYTPNAQPDLVNAHTIECWIKPIISPKAQFIVAYLQDSSENVLALTILSSGIVKYTAWQNPTLFSVLSDSAITPNAWTHLAGVYDGTTMLLYVNGVLQSASTTVAAPLTDVSTHKVKIGNSPSGSTKQYSGYISEIRFWSVARTVDQIRSAMFTHRYLNGINDGLIDPSLVMYFKLDDGTGTKITDSIGFYGTQSASFVGAYMSWETTEYPPLRYGASFIANRFTVTTSGLCSLIYPVAAPDDADHCLCVSWLDEDGQTTIRRRLYGASEDVGTEDIAPIPADYMGEVLPATFYLEFWNVDGKQYINLPSSLTIYTSHTSQPSHSIDHSSASDATPSGTTALAVNFPATFPMVFNKQQTYP